MTACFCAHEEILHISVVSYAFVSSLSAYCTTHPHIQPLSRKKATHLHDQTELTQTAEHPAPVQVASVNSNCSLARVRVHVLENLSGLIKQEVEACCMVLLFNAGAKFKQLQL